MKECRTRAGIPRGFAWAILLVLAVAPGPNARWGSPVLSADEPILPPDAAVRAYEAGRDAVRRREFGAGVRKLREALATGHVRPAEHFGTSRNFTDWYDPYYWLGVALMETGNDVEARENLEKSRAGGVIQRWPEFSSLLDRLATLQRREDARRAQLASQEKPSPTPTPFLAAPTATVLPPTPSPSAEPPVPPTPEPAAGTPAPRLRLADPAELQRVLQPLAAGDLHAAAIAITRLKSRSPDAVETDLLETVLYGTRYLVDGKTDAALLERARRSLSTYRKKGGTRKAEESWLSPPLLAILNGS